MKLGTLKVLFVVLLIIFLIPVLNDNLKCSIINTNDNILYITENKLDSNDETAKSDLDSTEIQDVEENKILNPYIPINEFKYADNQRYTLSGDLPLKETKIKILPAVIFGTGLTTVFIAQHIGQLRTIWDTLGEFKFQEDIEQDFFVDKYGHMFGSYFTSYLLSETLMECGLSYDAAAVWGGVLGLTYSTYVEVLDGFGVKWGFSPSDFYSDVLGSAFFIGQHYIPFLQNFTPKFMYFPADWHLDEPRMPHYMFIDDYSSQTFWLSVNVYNLLPEAAKDYWLPWLQISFGYAARNIVDVFHYPELMDKYKPITDVEKEFVWGSPRYIIALDYDLTKILPDGPGFWNWLRQSLMFFKFPSPAIEFSNSKTRFYLVYPFKL